jgi:hypothetical protein
VLNPTIHIEAVGLAPRRAIATRIVTVSLCALLLVMPRLAIAQDLFELEVLSFETVPPAQTEVAIQANTLPGGSATLGLGPQGAHYPFHLSTEVTHGWTGSFETGVFLETAPGVPGFGNKFAGGHIRPQFRFPQSELLPFKIALSVEYAFSRPEFDLEHQTIELRPILERHKGRLLLIANPALSMTIRGSETGPGRKVDFAGKAAWEAGPTVSTGLEYYKTGQLDHFEPSATQHQFVLPTLDLAVSQEWRFNVSAGHCVLDAREPWVFKSIIAYRFKQLTRQAIRLNRLGRL